MTAFTGLMCVVALLAGTAAGAQLRPLKYSSPNAALGNYPDETGKQLTDGITQTSVRDPKTRKRVTNLVIFTGGEVVIDVELPGLCKVERVVAHCYRPNNNYKLKTLTVLANAQGHWDELGSAEGYWGPTKQRAFPIEVKGLSASTQTLRLKFTTPHLLAITELEVHGTRGSGGGTTRGPYRVGAGLPLQTGKAVTVREVNADRDDVKEVVLENRFLRLIVDPVGGGAIGSLIVKPEGKELAYAYGGAGSKFGLLRDQLWEPYYYFAERVYSHRVEQYDDRAVAELWTTGAGGMMGFTEVRKRITIYRDDSRVRVDSELKNQPSSQTDYLYAWWFHSFAGVVGERTTYFFPTPDGVATYAYPHAFDGNQFEQWYYDPPRSWTGFIGESGVGLGIDVENKYLNCFYHWAGKGCLTPTLEWRLNRLEVPAGGVIKTTTFLYPCRGLKRIDGAFGGVVAALDVPAETKPGDGILAGLTVLSAESGTIECVWRTRRLPAADYAEAKRARLSVKAGEPVSVTQRVIGGEEAGTLVVSAQLLRGGKVLGDIERPVVIGGVRLPYAMKPEGPRVGIKGAKAQPTIAGHKLSTEVETPHVKWAKPYALGKIRALFVTGENESREIVELWQRMALDFTYDKFLSTTGDRSYLYAGDRSIRNLAQAQARLTENLKKPHDVIVISGMKWDFHFTKALRKTILDTVAAGAGLIVISPHGVDDGLAKVPCFVKEGRQNRGWGQWQSPAAHPVTSALPWTVLPRTRCFINAKAPGGETLAEIVYGARRYPLIVSARHGKGRVLSINWDVFTHSVSYMGFTGLTPILSYRGDYVDGDNKQKFCDRAGANPALPYHYWEYYYALLARSVAWAAKKEPPVQVVSVRVTPGKLSRDQLKTAQFTVQLRRAGEVRDVRVETTVRDRYSNPVATSTTNVTLTQPVQTLKLIPPATARDGMNFLDVIVRDTHGRSLGWGSGAFRVETPLRIEGIHFAKTELDPDEALSGSVHLAGTATGEEKLGLEVWDAYDRLLAKRSLTVARGKDGKPTFSFKTDGVIVPGLKLKAALRDAKGDVLDTAATRALVKPKHEYERLMFTSWSGNYKWRSHYLFPYAYRNVQELGLNVAMNGATEEGTGKVWDDLYHGIQWCPLGLLGYMDKKYRDFKAKDFAKQSAAYAKTKDKKHLVRFPCLDDPGFQKAVRDHMTAYAKKAEKYGYGHNYCMGDEMSLTDHARYFDYCYDPHTLRAFREWLRKEYGTLPALNKEWGTQFADWNAVTPMTADEVKGRKNYAPWADHREYMDVALARFFATIQDTLRTVDPNAKAGLSGTQRPAAGNGMDWWLMSKAFSFYHTYNTGWSEEMRRAFGASTGVMTSPYYAGYWLAGRRLENRLWYCLLHDTAGISAWTTRLFFYGDLTFSESGRDTREIINELKDGIWDVIRNADRQSDGIAIHYSQPSLRGMYITGKEREFDKTREAWVKLLHDMGFQFDFVAYAEVEQGLLRKRGYRVLVLPGSIALSEKEAQEIEAFAQAGGLVIADHSAALMDDHCKALPTPRLDALFGISRKAAGTAKVPDGILLAQAIGAVEPGKTLKLTGAEAGVAAATAKPLGRSAGGSPVLLTNRAGRGSTVYLNLGIPQYVDDRVFHSPTEAQLQQIMLALLGRSGVEPKVKITYKSKRPPHCEVVRYRSGRVEYVGIVRDYVQGGQAEAARVSFGRPAWVVDVRAGKALGRTDAVTVVLEPGQAKLYALLPEKAVAPMAVRLTSATVRGGDRVAYTVGPRPGANLSASVIHVEFVKPSGKVFRPYSQNHILKPNQLTARGSAQLSLNDILGKWTLRARDVATGATTETTLMVTPKR